MVIGAYDPIIAEASRRFGVPEERVRAVMSVESSGRRDAVSPKGAAGLMQVMAPTYTDLAKRHGFGPDRFEPRNNIMAGTAYLGEMYDQFGNWDEATLAYNMGPGRAMRVRNGTATVPAETAAYLPKVKAALATFGQTPANGPQTQEATVPLFTGPRAGSWTGLLEADDAKNFYEGLGGLLNVGQEPSQPPRTDPAALPGTTQTDRLGVGSRMNEVLQQLLQPQRPALSPLQYQLAGAGSAVGQLAGVRDRRVGIGELLGALGGGLTRGAAAAEQARSEDLQGQLGNLVGAAKLQDYQRDDATRLRQAQGVAELAAQLRKEGRVQEAQMLEANPALLTEFAKQKFKVPEAYTLAPGAQRRDAAGNIIADNPRAPGTAAPPTPVTLGNGPQGPGVYARNPDGSLGPRLGASETGQDVVEPPSLEQAAQEAQVNGLPPPPANSPYANPNLSPRGRSNLVAAEAKRWEKRAADNAEAVKSANGLITDMQRFQYLNSQTDTGGVTGSPIGSAVRSLYDDNIKEMNSITARITPTLRQPGSGATSDFDARMFQEGTVGVGKPRQVNDNIATATIEGGKNLIAKAQFEQAYYDSYQHTSGMEAAWQQYLNANPIFDPKAKPGSFALNQNRVDWQTYFRNGMKAQEPGRPQAPMSGGEGGNVPPPPPGSVIVP